jgi:ABC-type Zn uptake system ZnuABC Zn-binding protein ZnuA
MKKIFLSSLFALSALLFSCGNAEVKKQDDGNTPVVDTSKGISAALSDSLGENTDVVVYVCPCGGCPEVREPKSGKCPKCEMGLVVEKK